MTEHGPNSPHGPWLRIIAIAKLAKAAALIAIGVGALRMSNRESAELLHHQIVSTGIHPGSHLLHAAIARVSGLDPHQLREIGVATFVYAALFLTEGLGLLAEKRWAEYFTVIVTGSFVPLEVYETAHHFTWLRVLATALNLAAVSYVIYVLRHSPSARRNGAQPEGAAGA